MNIDVEKTLEGMFGPLARCVRVQAERLKDYGTNDHSPDIMPPEVTDDIMQVYRKDLKALRKQAERFLRTPGEVLLDHPNMLDCELTDLILAAETLRDEVEDFSLAVAKLGNEEVQP